MLCQGGLRWVDMNPHRDVAGNINKRQSIITPILRLLFSLTSLVDTSEFFEVSIICQIFTFCHFLVILSVHFFWSFFFKEYAFCPPILTLLSPNFCVKLRLQLSHCSLSFLFNYFWIVSWVFLVICCHLPPDPLS